MNTIADLAFARIVETLGPIEARHLAVATRTTRAKTAQFLKFLGSETSEFWIEEYKAWIRDRPPKRTLVKICERGYLHTAKWHAVRRTVSPNETRHAFRVSCLKGRLEMAQWLVERFELTAEDARADDNFALRWSCTGGHLETAKWLVARFDLTAADARASDNSALRHSCAYGHLKVVQWLVDKFDLTAADVRAYNNYALRYSSEFGHRAMTKWLTTTFAYTEDELAEFGIEMPQ